MSATSSASAVNNVSINATDSVIQQISGISQQLSGLSMQLKGVGDSIRALVAQLQAIEDTKPQSPGPGAGEKAQKRYAEALGKWKAENDSKIANIQNAIQGLNKQIEIIGDKINDAMKKLDDLKNQDLPRAQEKDRAAAEKQAEDAAKQLEAVGKDAEKELEKLDDPQLLAKVQWKTIELRRTTNSEDLEGLSLKDIIKTFQIVFAQLPETSATTGGKNVYTGAGVQAAAMGLPGVGSGEPPAITADDEQKVEGAGAAS